MTLHAFRRAAVRFFLIFSGMWDRILSHGQRTPEIPIWSARNEALEGFFGDTGILAKNLKGYGILGSILKIWGYNAS